MEKLLFANESLANYLVEKNGRARSALAAVHTADGLDADLRERMVTLGKAEPVTLDRGGADLKVHERSATGLYRVTATVPFTGDHNLLSLKADTFTLNPPRGEVLGGYTREPKAVRFSTEFHNIPSSDEVKTWAKRCADDVEKHLEFQAAQLDRHNKSLETDVDGQIVRRHGELNAINDVNDDLAGGI